MRDLHLHRLIPVAAACALNFAACGGKATDGGGDGDGDGSFASPGLPGSFERRLEQGLRDLCERQIKCYEDYYEYGDANLEECVDSFNEGVQRAYQLDSTGCQLLMLAALECTVNISGCSDESGACYDEVYWLFKECSDYDYYDYYDYDDGDYDDY